MYDNTNAANVAALKSELQTNPTALTGPGNTPLQTLAANGQDADCANVLNKVRNGLTIQRDDVTPQEVLEAIDIRDLVAAPAGVASIPLTQSWLESISQAGAIRLFNAGGGQSRAKNNLDRIVGDTQGSQTRLNAVGVRNGSRTEQLFGVNSIVSASDCGHALRG